MSGWGSGHETKEKQFINETTKQNLSLSENASIHKETK